MRRTPHRRPGLLPIPIPLATGLAVALVAAQGCGRPAGTGTDGGAICGTAPVSDCGPCADGVACGHGASVCTHGTCAAGCYVGGAFYQAGATDPTADCQVCDPSRHLHGFSPKADGTPCPGNGNPCTQNVCSAGTCSHPPVAQGTACGTSGQCDGSGHCSQGCTVGGTFYPDGTADPSNPCKACEVGNSTTAWTALAAGTACGTGKICDASHTCSAGCLIGGAFYTPGQNNPTNPCQACTPTVMTNAWSDVAANTACPSDGNPCTNDVCDGAGSCSHPAANGAACGSGMVCNGTTCATGCFIGGTYYPSGGTPAGNACSVCVPSTSTTTWTPGPNGVACDDGNLCTTNDLCSGGQCQGTPISCAPPSQCDEPGTCNPATGVCSYAPQPAGTACGGSSCGGSGYCDSAGTCDRCDAAGSQCCAPVSGQPGSYACAPASATLSCQ